MYLLKFLRIVLRNGKRIVRWRMAAQERTHQYLHVFERSLSVSYSMEFITLTDVFILKTKLQKKIRRSIDVDYTEDVVKNGVTFYRYAGTEKMFGSADKYPDNWCFCSGGVCNPTGVTNSSTCRFGAPAFVSFPHYYLADPFFKNQVEGLNPQKELHEFHIDLEPVERKIFFHKLSINRINEPIFNCRERLFHFKSLLGSKLTSRCNPLTESST